MNLEKSQIVTSCLIAAILYILIGWPKEIEGAWSPWIAIALVGIAFFNFNGKFTDNKYVTEVTPAANIGPTDSYPSPKIDYEIDPLTNLPVRKVVPDRGR